MQPPKRNATREDLAALPHQLVGEIIGGELIATPRPAASHARAAAKIAADLAPLLQRSWWIVDSPEVRFGDDILVPDLAGWQRKRLPQVPTSTAIAVVPDWICEVLSPATERIDRTRKLALYARHKVSYVWLVNPLVSTLEVYRRDSKTWLLLGSRGGDDRVRSALPFEGLELKLAHWWSQSDDETNRR